MARRSPLVATHSDRRVGCEFECLLVSNNGNDQDARQRLSEILTANGIRAVARGYSECPIPAGYDVAVEYDCSVRGCQTYEGVHFAQVETKTKILNGPEDWDRVVPKLLSILQYLGAKVNHTTGFHIHVDLPEARDDLRVVRSLYNLIHKYEPVIYGLVSPSRRSPSGHSMPLSDETKRLHWCRSRQCYQQAIYPWSRRTGLNLNHVLSNSPRIEFRYHQGTLDVDKARHWYRLMVRLVDHATTRSCQASTKGQVPNTRKGFDSFRHCIGLRTHPGIYSQVDSDLRETSRYLLMRHKHFARLAVETRSEIPSQHARSSMACAAQ